MLCRALLTFAAAAGITGCEPAADHEPFPSEGRSLYFVPLAQGANLQPGCATSRARVIRDQDEWAAFWSEVHPADARPPLPAIDFDGFEAIAVCGPRTDAGHRSEIARARRLETGGVVAMIRDTQPATGCPFPAMPHYGFHVIGVWDADVLGFERESAESCDASSLDFGWQTIEFGDTSGCSEGADRLIREPAEWSAFWAQLVTGRLPPPEEPDVDFERYSVIVTCLGERPTGGYLTRIGSVTLDDSGAAVVSIEDSEPGICGVTHATTQPYHVVLVNRALDAAAFSHSAVVVDCG
jgi:hypothetical protein